MGLHLRWRRHARQAGYTPDVTPITVITNYYFFGGIYEVETNGATTTTTRYYAVAGQVEFCLLEAIWLPVELVVATLG